MYDSINTLKLIKTKNTINIFNKDGKYLFIQAPKGFCNKKIDINSTYLWISFLNDNKDKKDFYIFLNSFKECIENLLNGEVVQKFYYENGIGIPFQNFKGNNIVELYYNKETRMDLIDCPERYYIKPLIWFHNVKYVDKKWYINYYLIQGIIYPIYLKLGKCLIDDNQTIEPIYKKKIDYQGDDINSECVSYLNHSVYGKYFKMLQIGIPRGAVQIKIVNELGESAKTILDHNCHDAILIRKIKQCDHVIYGRFFKMLNLGIPRMAVEQKMLIENIDKEILHNPDKMIYDLPIICNDFGKILSLKKLRKLSINNSNKVEDKKIIHGLQFNMEDILKKREEILNKLNK
jgi:hypothetical protein